MPPLAARHRHLSRRDIATAGGAKVERSPPYWWFRCAFAADNHSHSPSPTGGSVLVVRETTVTTVPHNDRLTACSSSGDDGTRHHRTGGSVLVIVRPPHDLVVRLRLVCIPAMVIADTTIIIDQSRHHKRWCSHGRDLNATVTILIENETRHHHAGGCGCGYRMLPPPPDWWFGGS